MVRSIEEYMPERKVFTIDEQLKSLCIWPDMPEGPTLGNVVDFVNDFRRRNSEVWQEHMQKKPAGYLLAGCSRIKEGVVMVYNHPDDVASPGEGIVRDVVLVRLNRVTNTSLEGEKVNTVTVDIGFIPWTEQQKEVVIDDQSALS